MTTEPATAEHGACDAGLIRVFELLGKRWNGLILAVLRDGPMKFSELRRAVGSITDSMLSDRLVDLAAFGMVVRTEQSGRPPQITYALTERAEGLLPLLDRLGAWADEVGLQQQCSEAARKR